MRRWRPWALAVGALLWASGVQASGGLSLGGGSVVVTGPAGLDTTGDIALSSGTLQASGPAQFHVGGNWTQSGSGAFVADQSQVFLTGDATLSGSSNFYSLTAASAGQTLTFPAGLTQTVTHDFTLTGSAGSLSKLRSSDPGSFAYLSCLGSSNLNYVDARDSNAFGGSVLNAGPHSVLAHTINWSYGGALLPPHPVVRLGGSLEGPSGSSVMYYSWAPVTAYADGTPVPDGIGTTYEVTRYPDLTDPSNGTLIAEGLTGTSFGPVGSSQYGFRAYYGIRAVVDGVKSDPFYVDNTPSPSYAYAADGLGYALVPPALQGPFRGASPSYYRLDVLPSGLSGPGIVAGARLQVANAEPGGAAVDYHFSPPGATLVLRVSGQAAAAGQSAFPVQLQADGAWRTVGTATPGSDPNTVSFTAYQPGLYRVGADPGTNVIQSVHPRVFSPNGDGYNDIVYFDLNNGDGEPASGEIFDLQAAKVATLAPARLGLQWDGRGPGGRVVPGGVYIYQIRVGSRRVNGTVVVVR